MRGLSFGYPGADKLALSDINFEATPGQVIALVGRSGAGKTTLIDLIAGFERAPQNTLFYDAIDSSDIQAASIRKNVALVTQDTILFEDSIRANIAYGELSHCTDASIIAAAQKAHIWDLIESLPLGLETPVGENGAALSGGQKQRIALARAFLKDAPLLILDEATSALDAESERAIQQVMPEITAGRTTVIIAHRLITAERADLILVLDQGRIVESGSHADLIQRDVLYAHLHRSQFDD